MEVEVKTPVKVYVDKKEEIFISENTTFKRKKNINKRYHFIRHKYKRQDH